MMTAGVLMFLIGAAALDGAEWIIPLALCIVGGVLVAVGAARKGAWRL